jgi:hypothetical protein
MNWKGCCRMKISRQEESEGLRRRLAEAAVEWYRAEDQEAAGEAECRAELLGELNRRLDLWGVDYRARGADLAAPRDLVAHVAEGPAAHQAVGMFRERVAKWAREKDRSLSWAGMILDQGAGGGEE